MTIDNYGGLAAVYDRLNAEIDYVRWAAYIQAQIAAHSDIPVSLVLDLCCGTGSMTLALDALGYDMIGADISPDMLAVAREKAAEAGRAARILFLCQDMRALELYGTVQAVTCTLDALNHVDGAGDLARVFALVHNYLEPGGLFLFDLNAPYKFEHVYGTNAYILEDDGIFCGWQNVYDPARRVCDFIRRFSYGVRTARGRAGKIMNGSTVFCGKKSKRCSGKTAFPSSACMEIRTAESPCRTASGCILQRSGNKKGLDVLWKNHGSCAA